MIPNRIEKKEGAQPPRVVKTYFCVVLDARLSNLLGSPSGVFFSVLLGVSGGYLRVIFSLVGVEDELSSRLFSRDFPPWRRILLCVRVRGSPQFGTAFVTGLCADFARTCVSGHLPEINGVSVLVRFLFVRSHTPI